MTINDFMDEYDNLSTNRKAEFLIKLCAKLVKLDEQEKEDDEELIARTILDDFLNHCIMEEEMDYFGTEGFDG